MEREAGTEWHNWAGGVSCRPEWAFYPERLEDLVAIGREARARGRKLRVVGGGHAWSPLVPTDAYLVHLNKLDRISVDVSNPARPTVTLEAGATVEQVNRVLARHGLAIPSNVVLESVRYGGLIATGSHGSGRAMDTL